MPFSLFLSNLSCFYCGCRSNHRRGIRQFQCQSCEAVNHLDENGQITDPPPEASLHPADSVRYAHPTARPHSPSSSLDDIFCRTCLQNQHLLKETLASYLPPEDDPQYHHYLASYDAYREKLESRFPQVCLQCAPRARDQIKKSAYVAQTDHLRRMMEQTRRTGIEGSSGRLFLNLMVRLGGVGWVLSAIGQACWHGLAAHSVSVSTGEFQNGMDELYTAHQLYDGPGKICLQRLLRNRSVDHACGMAFSDAMPTILLFGFLTIWWNKQLWTSYVKSGSRVSRTGEYYSLQVIILAVRIAAWHILDAPTSSITGETLKGAHFFMALLISTVYFISIHTVKIDTKSRVSFHLSDGSVLPDVGAATNRSSITDSAEGEREPFPIHKLASPGTPSIFRQTSQGPPTPQHFEHDDDPDAMDWTPAPKRQKVLFNSPSRAPTSHVVPTMSGPSPFHGTLPPAPIAPAHRLRQPLSANPAAFRKASESQKDHFAAGMSTAADMQRRPFLGQLKPTYANGYESDTTVTEMDDDSVQRNQGGRRKTAIQIAAPKFWPSADIERKTGLEDIFEGSFSIRDSPVGVSNFPSTPKASTDRGKRLGRGGPRTARDGERWGGFGERMGAAPFSEERSPPGESGTGLLLAMIPVVILGVSVVVVKGGWI